jgi:hypothetical protein
MLKSGNNLPNRSKEEGIHETRNLGLDLIPDGLKVRNQLANELLLSRKSVSCLPTKGAANWDHS